mmetsp:Transcript_3159/g.12073  ORF Transcript_3159/g.12073 Transcript_3159/m.12073 type:complete len:200 (+) Transcript_3159:1231-1830(+)
MPAPPKTTTVSSPTAAAQLDARGVGPAPGDSSLVQVHVAASRRYASLDIFCSRVEPPKTSMREVPTAHEAHIDSPSGAPVVGCGRNVAAPSVETSTASAPGRNVWHTTIGEPVWSSSRTQAEWRETGPPGTRCSDSVHSSVCKSRRHTASSNVPPEPGSPGCQPPMTWSTSSTQTAAAYMRRPGPAFLGSSRSHAPSVS